MLQRISELKRVIFDKTGTLTMGKPRVSGSIPDEVGDAIRISPYPSGERVLARLRPGSPSSLGRPGPDEGDSVLGPDLHEGPAEDLEQRSSPDDRGDGNDDHGQSVSVLRVKPRARDTT